MACMVHKGCRLHAYGLTSLITLLPLMHMHAPNLKSLSYCNAITGLEEDPGLVSGCCGVLGSPQGEALPS